MEEKTKEYSTRMQLHIKDFQVKDQSSAEVQRSNPSLEDINESGMGVYTLSYMPINNNNTDNNVNNNTDHNDNNNNNYTDNNNDKFARSLMWESTLAYQPILWASRTALFGCEYPNILLCFV